MWRKRERKGAQTNAKQASNARDEAVDQEPADDEAFDETFDEGAVEIPIDGVLDLHFFHPRDVRTLVPDYLEECHKRGIYAVRIIHGKGTGALQRSVHALLERSPLVASFRLAGIDAGGWGATLVDLKERP